MTNVVTLSVDDDTLRLLGFGAVTLITTVGKDGSTNATPHGCSTVASYSPPQILIPVDTTHDTYRNTIEAKKFVINIPRADLIKQIWIAQKHFPYGTSELEQAKPATFPAEKVKPSRIRECKAYIECKVVWTKIVSSSCLILGDAEVISSRREIEKLGIEELAIALNRLIFLSYQKGENERRWMFAEIGKAHTPTERDGRVRMESETV